jgi:hypothetical protein
MPDPKSPWCALYMMQRKILAAAAAAVSDSPTRNGCKLMYPKSLQVIKVDDRRKIIIPAARCSNPKKATSNVLFMDSFLGGNQLHLRSNATLEYTLTPDLLTPTAKQ